MDVSKIKKMGWAARISLEEGLRTVYKEYAATAAGRNPESTKQEA